MRASMLRLLGAALLACVLLAGDAGASYLEPAGCGQLPALTGSVTTSAGSCATSVASGTTLTDTLNQEFHVSTAELDATNTVTLGTVTGLSQALTAGKTYACSGHLTGTSSATAGIKAALVATNSLSATSASFTGFAWNGTTPVANTTVTALGSSIVANAAAYTDLFIEGAIVVNVTGTINVQAAQDVQTSGSTNTAKVFINSTFACVRVS